MEVWIFLFLVHKIQLNLFKILELINLFVNKIKINIINNYEINVFKYINNIIIIYKK